MPTPSRVCTFIASAYWGDEAICRGVLFQCNVQEPSLTQLGSWWGQLRVDPALLMVLAGCRLELRVFAVGDPKSYILLEDSDGNFVGVGPPPGYPAWRIP
jgi:hypothetical protein